MCCINLQVGIYCLRQAALEEAAEGSNEKGTFEQVSTGNDDTNGADPNGPAQMPAHALSCCCCLCCLPTLPHTPSSSAPARADKPRESSQYALVEMGDVPQKYPADALASQSDSVPPPTFTTNGNSSPTLTSADFASAQTSIPVASPTPTPAPAQPQSQGEVVSVIIPPGSSPGTTVQITTPSGTTVR